MKNSMVLIILTFLISCSSYSSKQEVITENIQFSFGKNNAEPNLVSKDGNLTLSWISSEVDQEAVLYYSQFKDKKWKKHIRWIDIGSGKVVKEYIKNIGFKMEYTATIIE